MSAPKGSGRRPAVRRAIRRAVSRRGAASNPDPQRLSFLFDARTDRAKSGGESLPPGAEFRMPVVEPVADPALQIVEPVSELVAEAFPEPAVEPIAELQPWTEPARETFRGDPHEPAVPVRGPHARARLSFWLVDVPVTAYRLMTFIAKETATRRVRRITRRLLRPA